MDNYSLTINALVGTLNIANSALEQRVLSLLPVLAEQRARHWTKGAHGYFTGSYSDGAGGGGSGGKGLDKSGGSGIIKAEIEKGSIKLEINPEKQARHIKGSPEYKEGRSYLTINMAEAQDVINIKNGTGVLLKDKDGKPVKERIDCDRTIGVDIDKNSGEETITDKGTIHYSKTGTHLVPRKENND